MTSSPAPTLVAGASGYIGGQLVRALLDRGIPVRAMSRDPERLAHLHRLGADVVTGDVFDRRSLRAALAGVQRAYYLVHSMAEGGSEGAFAEWDRYGAQNFAAEGQHLEQVIYLGGLGRPDDALSAHLRSRLEVGEILLAGKAPATVLRAGIVIGRDSVSFQMLLYLVKRLPVMVCPRWVLTRTQPIAIEDTVAYLIAALGNREAANRSLEIGGPDVLTYREMMEGTAAILGKKLTIVTVPVLTPRLSSYWVDFVTPIPASIAHPLIEGLRNEVIVQDGSARTIMPVSLTPFSTAVKLALATPPAAGSEG